jgi:hypothetical protein
MGRSEEEPDLRIALQMMEQAVAIDPDFAVAHAQLGRCHSAMFWHHYDRIDRLEFLLERPGQFSKEYLKLDPTWIPLREHPRFQSLVGE